MAVSRRPQAGGVTAGAGGHRAGASSAPDDAARPVLPVSQLWGLFLFSLSTLLGASTSVITKLLGGSGHMPVMQLVFVRSCVLVACTLPHLRHPLARRLVAERHELLLLRGVLGFVSVSAMYLAVCLLPLSDAVALAFVSPILVAALSRPLLQERPHRSVPFALALAGVGALMLARPATFGTLLPWEAAGAGSTAAAAKAATAAATPARPNPVGVAAALAHALAAAFSKITVRRLGVGTSSPHVAGIIVLSAGAMGALGAGAVCVLQRGFVRPEHPAHWALLAAVGLTGLGHQLAMTAGLQRVQASTASSLTYLSAIWSLLADALVFKHMPTPSSLLGAAAICSAGLLVACWRQKGGGGGSGASGGGGRDGGGGSAVADLGGQRRQAQQLVAGVQDGGDWDGQGADVDPPGASKHPPAHVYASGMDAAGQ